LRNAQFIKAEVIKKSLYHIINPKAVSINLHILLMKKLMFGVLGLMLLMAFSLMLVR
jgi:hypothetical protein